MTAAFIPTHTAPPGGLTARAVPDPRVPAVANIEERVEMRVIQRYGDWAQVECSNGWRAWVDARPLIPATTQRQAQPAAPASRGSLLGEPLFRLGGYAITLRQLIPGAGLVLGALLPWLRGAIGSGTSFDVPVLLLIDTEPAALDFTLGYVLMAAAVIVTAVPPVALRLATCTLAVAACVLFAIQLQRVLAQVGSTTNSMSFIGYGVLVTAVAAALGGYWCLRSRGG